MPRLTVKTPAYCRHKASGRALVTLDGHDFYLGPYGSPESKAEYRRLIAEWTANGRKSPRTAPATDLAVGELMAAFMQHTEREHRRPDGKPGSKVEKVKLALRPVRELYGATFARDFDSVALETVRKAMIDKGLCVRTVNQRITRVRGMFRWGASQKMVPLAIYHDLKELRDIKPGRFGAKPSKKIKPVPDAHVEAVKPFLSRQLQAVVELQSLTGMRSADVLALRASEIDRTGPTWLFRPIEHKSAYLGKERTVPLGPKARAIIQSWQRDNPHEHLFSTAEAMAELRAEHKAERKTPLTPSQRARQRKAKPKKAPGDHYDSRAYQHAIARACKQAGVPHWHPHQLMHNAATYLMKEFGMDTARAVLGHSSATTTELYAELDASKATDAMEKIG